MEAVWPRKVAAIMVHVPSPAGCEVEAQVGASEQAVGGLLEALRLIPDVRKARGVRYPQASMLALCVVAFMCGRQNLTQVMRFGRAHKGLLKSLGFRRRRPPSVPTLSRVFSQIRVKDLQRALTHWFVILTENAAKRGRCAVAAVDGKTSRACGVHVLNVFLHDLEQVVWQVPVGEKANEISALKEALEELFDSYPFLSILTGDAMFAGEPLCGALIERGRDYVFQVKADQKHLHEKMKILFGGVLSHAAPPSAVTGEKKGRLCRRSPAMGS